jgi:hypothetical protein
MRTKRERSDWAVDTCGLVLSPDGHRKAVSWVRVKKPYKGQGYA